MAHPWFRLWVDMVNDPKWRTIARTSRRSISEVIAVALHMMTLASSAEVRGYIDGFEDEDVATALDMDTAGVTAIRDAMQGRFLHGDQLLGWEKRQRHKEDSTTAERSQRYRDKKKAASVTLDHAASRRVTPDKRTGEEEDKPLPTPAGVGSRRKPPAPPCPHTEIVALYHDILPMCPVIREWTKARQDKLRARWNEAPERQNLDYWRRFFEYVATCDFLVGRTNTPGRKPFYAPLYWMLGTENFTKIRERMYEQ